MTSRVPRFLAPFLGLTLLFAVLWPAAPATALSAPTRLKALSTSVSAIGVAWTPVSGGSRYRVQYSTSSSMSGAKYVTVDAPAVELTGLSAGKTYYIKTRVVSAENAELSSYSSALKVTTRSSGYSYLAPTGLTVTERTSASLALAWDGRGDGIRYRVSWSTSSTFSGAKYVRVTGTSTTLTGLSPAKKYYLKVRVITESGSNLSAYSPKITAATEPAASLPAPSGLKVTALAKTAVALDWQEVDGAQRYRIQYSASASMSSPKYVRVSGSSTTISSLASGKTYYFKIRVITPEGANLGPYSPAVSAKTPTSSSATYLPPSGLAASGTAAAKLTATWASRGTGLTYQVQYSTSAELSGAKTVTVKATSTTIGGLEPDTEHFLRVRVVSSTGSALSAFSPAVVARTNDSVPTKLRVASYNVKCANCYAALPNEGTWYERRDAVVSTVLRQQPDVIGFQEASQGWLKDASGKSVDLSQFEDLVKRLGSPYKLTNTHRNNCVKSTTPTGCVYKDQGASQGTKIVYNSAKLTLLKQGSKRLAEVRTKDNDRYMAWAVFEHKQTGKRFMFGNTHLENQGDSSGSTTFHDLRVTQTREGIAALKANNPEDLPTYVVGDYNSHKWTLPSNGPYDELIRSGYVDPLGNAYRTMSTTPGATVQKRIRTNFSSYNSFKLKAPSFTYINGTYLDYIWTSKGIEVPEWETVVDIDAAGNFVGRIPSDHNLIRADTLLP